MTMTSGCEVKKVKGTGTRGEGRGAFEVGGGVELSARSMYVPEDVEKALAGRLFHHRPFTLALGPGHVNVAHKPVGNERGLVAGGKLFGGAAVGLLLNVADVQRHALQNRRTVRWKCTDAEVQPVQRYLKEMGKGALLGGGEEHQHVAKIVVVCNAGDSGERGHGDLVDNAVVFAVGRVGQQQHVISHLQIHLLGPAAILVLERGQRLLCAWQ